MLTTLAAFVLTLGVLIIIHELGHYSVARACGVRVLRFSLGFGPVMVRRRDRHGTEWVVSMLPLGGYVRMLDEREGPVPDAYREQTFNRLSVWRRIAIVAAGPAANLLLAILLYGALYATGVPQPAPGQGVPVPVVRDVVDGGPAQRAGLQADDRILEAGGRPVLDADSLVALIAAHDGQPLLLRVERQGQPQQLSVEPEVGADGGPARIGVRLGVATTWLDTPQGVLTSLWLGTQRTWEVATMSLRMLWRMVTGDASWRNLSGPVTIADYAGQTARIGLGAYIAFLALVSVSLGVLNLLPIPVLDGGHLLYYLVEIVRGSPPPESWLAFGQRVGLLLLLGFMGLALFNDFARLLG